MVPRVTAMMNWLIAMAVFFWCMATIVSYIFITDQDDPFLKRIVHSVRLDFRRSAGLKVLPSMFQAIYIYWIVLGIMINWLSEAEKLLGYQFFNLS